MRAVAVFAASDRRFSVALACSRPSIVNGLFVRCHPWRLQIRQPGYSRWVEVDTFEPPPPEPALSVCVNESISAQIRMGVMDSFRWRHLASPEEQGQSRAGPSRRCKSRPMTTANSFSRRSYFRGKTLSGSSAILRMSRGETVVLPVTCGTPIGAITRSPASIFCSVTPLKVPDTLGPLTALVE